MEINRQFIVTVFHTINYIQPIFLESKLWVFIENAFAIGDGHGVSLITWDGKSQVAKPVGPKKLFSLETDNPSSGTDIVAADPIGRFYLGTFSSKLCKGPPNLGVYRYIFGKGIKRLFGGIHGTSALSVDPIARKLYHSEYCTLVLSQFDWSPITGDLCKWCDSSFF